MRVRNDFVLVEMLYVEQNKEGLALPQSSIQGKEFVVREFGPKVEGLNKGDKVLMVGNAGVSYYPLPNSNTLIVIKQENVVLVFDGETA